jgi:glycosyltransferase 2 family protein
VKKNKILQILKWIWVVAIIIFIGVFFYRNLPEAIQYLQEVPFGLVIASAVCIVIAKLLIVLLALLSVNTGEWRPSFLSMFTIFTVSQLGKYIPGSIWHFAARINAYKDNALSNKKTAQAMIIENLWLVTGAAAFGVIFLSLNHTLMDGATLLPVELPEWLWNLLPLLVLIFWIAGLLLLDKRYPTSSKGITISRVLLLLLIQSGIWLSLGISYYLLFLNAGTNDLFLILGGYALSWIAGYLVIFAPGGIGVRETVQVFLFSTISTPQQVVIISLMHRMVYTIVEVLLGLVGYLLTKRVARDQNPIPG